MTPTASEEAMGREITDFLHDQIPITRAMGVAVESFSETGLVLTAPLEANHNHLGTAFGGSLATIATLAGYGFLWLRLGDRTAHVVIKSSKVRYLHPVRGVIRASCRAPDPAVLDEFRATFARNEKARLHLFVTIEEGSRVCVEFEGEFVAMK